MARFAVGDPWTVGKANAVPYMVFNTQGASGVASNPVGGVPASVYAPSVPANTLDEDGDRLLIEATFALGATANTKQVLFYFGGTAIVSYASTVGSTFLRYRLRVIRLGASSELVFAESADGAGHTGNTGTVAAVALGSAVVCDFQIGGVAANDVILYEAFAWTLGKAV